MEVHEKKASEAAATAPKAGDVTPEKLTTLFSRKASAGARASLRAAINAMCRSCIYDPGSGNGGWREQVKACSSSNCALHLVRPLPIKATKKAGDACDPASGTADAPAVGSALPSTKVGLNDQAADRRHAA
jgi:hypothetical protein